MFVLSNLAVLLTLAGGAFWLRGREAPAWSDAAERWLGGPAAPWAFGALSGLAYLWIIGWTFHPPAMITDEQAYVLQAQIFAHLRWTAPTPPFPEFFSQAYVLLAPAIAAKYFPGHSLLLAPGVALGLPWLVPWLLDACAGGLVFALARRVGRPALGLLTWTLWIFCRSNLAWRVSYFSEVTTSVLWLAGWWCALEWWATGRRRWMVLLGLVVGWGAITRPYSMLLYALPLAGVLGFRIWRARRFGDLAAGVVAMALVLGMLPFWAWRSTGDWRVTPLERYTATYMPFDRMGFAPADPPVRDTLPFDQAAVIQHLREVHAAHTLPALPTTIAERGVQVGLSVWDTWRIGLIPAAVAGLFFLTGAGWVAVGTSLLLFAGYLLWGHESTWTLYYVELVPGLEFLTACGILGVLARVAGRGPADERCGAAAALAAVPVMLAFSLAVAHGAAVRWSYIFAPRYQFEGLLARVPPGPKTVFVRYKNGHYAHSSLVTNDPFFATSPLWLAYDRGDADTLLIRAAPERTPYLYDERSGNLARIVWEPSPRH
ncbi:MAG TPA: hypothetical protein VFI39_08680 [Gemmatimonadales bacterium]|nr:hypothetical protein [Gemmatimonadales bacterium]